MIAAIVQRLALAAFSLVLASLIVFAALQVLPGDPAQVILGTGAQLDTLNALREQLGLNDPLAVRYLSWVGHMLMGDLQTSYTYGVPVLQLIADRLAVSGPLALLSIALTLAIALPAGMVSASARGRPTDALISASAQIGLAIPNFWFAMLLIFLFAVALGWLPAGGFAGWDNGLRAGLNSLILPAIALALPQAAILTRVTRAALLDVLEADYIRTARAKGLSTKAIRRHHALRNALIPVITILGLQFAFLLAGTIIIENVFYLPGVGRLLFQAISQRDLIVVQDLVMLIVAIVIIINLLVDLAALAIDPRLQGQRHAAR